MSFTPRNYQIKLDADSDESVADMPPLSKRCYKCGVFRSIVNFHADGRNKRDGRQAACKECRAAFAEAKRRREGVQPLTRNSVMAVAKICTKCRCEKEVSEFGVDTRTGDGRTSQCLKCKRLASNRYNRARGFPERLPQRPDVVTKICKTCRLTLAVGLFYKTRHGRNGDGRMPHCKKCWNEKSKQTRLRMFDYYNQYHSARRSVFRKATPAWLTKEQQDEINDCYWRARDCSLVTGEPYEVDHVIPIKGRGVCGLHVPWNLQLLPMTVNRVKSNKVL